MKHLLLLVVGLTPAWGRAPAVRSSPVLGHLAETERGARREKQRPAPEVSQNDPVAVQVRALVQELQDPQYAVRQTASHEIEKLMDTDAYPTVVATLGQEAERATNLEARNQIETLLRQTKIDPLKLLQDLLGAYRASPRLKQEALALEATHRALLPVAKQIEELQERHRADRLHGLRFLDEANRIAFGALAQAGIEASGETILLFYAEEKGKTPARVRINGAHFSVGIGSIVSGKLDLRFRALDPIHVSLDELLTPLQQRSSGITGSLALSPPLHTGPVSTSGKHRFYAKRFTREAISKLSELVPEERAKWESVESEWERLALVGDPDNHPLEIIVNLRR